MKTKEKIICVFVFKTILLSILKTDVIIIRADVDGNQTRIYKNITPR